jgi:V/A-type H+-transporting ATPase subunit C
MKGTNYIYASAKIRALEPRILDETDIERMIDAPDLNSAFKILNDTDYADNLLDLKPSEYRKALSLDFEQLHDLLQKITPDQSLFELILLERDFTNIKLLFKAKLFGIDVEKFIKENVIYTPEHLEDFIYETHIHTPKVLKAYITEQKGQVLDHEIKDVIYRVSKKINEKTRPDELDAILTQEYFDLKQELAKEVGSRFIKNYVKMEIDNLNLLIWVRAKRLGLNKEKLNEKLIHGGHADIKKMVWLYPEEARGLKSFVNANFDMYVTEAFETFCEDNNLFLLEKEFEDYKTRYARQAKRFSYGPEVVFAYFLAKQNAIQNIRIILTGKLNNLPKEEIKKTLRETH